MLHGRAIIDLHNNKTHLDERIVHDNMLTNWIRDSIKPWTIYRQGRPSVEDLDYNNIFGGLMMFNAALPNDADDYLFPSPHTHKMIAHANHQTYSGTDLTRGSYNEAQSVATDGTITKVWDFTQEQGNGNIASLGLCSIRFAICGNGTKTIPATESRNTYHRIYNNRSSVDGTAYGSGRGFRFFDGISGTTIVARCTNGILSVIEVPAHWVKFNPTVGQHGTAPYFYIPSNVSVETYDLSAISTNNYIASHVSNSGVLYMLFGTSLANGASTTLVAFDLRARTYTTQTLTNNTGAELRIGLNEWDNAHFAIDDDGYLYIATTSNKIAFINLADNTDCGIVKAPNGADDLQGVNSSICSTISKYGNWIIAGSRGYLFSNTSAIMYIINKGVSWYGGWSNIQMVGYQSDDILCAGQSIAKHLFAYGGYSGNTSGEYGESLTEIPCLATINNLESAVTKTADMTMRVTYTVTDAAE